MSDETTADSWEGLPEGTDTAARTTLQAAPAVLALLLGQRVSSRARASCITGGSSSILCPGIIEGNLRSKTCRAYLRHQLGSLT